MSSLQYMNGYNLLSDPVEQFLNGVEILRKS